MKKVLFVLAVIIMVVSVVIFSPKETVMETTSVLDEVTDVEVRVELGDKAIGASVGVSEAGVANINREQEIDFSGFQFEPEEEIISSSSSAEATESTYQQQKMANPIWNRHSTQISTDELALARDNMNKLIYDINVAIELEGSYQPPGGRKMLGGDLKVTAQICGLENDLFNFDYEFQSMSAQHYCFDVLRNLMSSSVEYKETKDTLKKLSRKC
ncbi:hypothetical protein [Psychromonas sp. Urea-02u-13]|uniref:hypothetical protein n=1 Tax=Psychromonas sp. Urea-02u-13 TaxID=2058326 RepID=UPI000C33D710|nr:hypothetical protein [Psychromonas sp. Urea-02u-13]PKG38853.1 hypothetical protein CXF74_11535 [Psychromonas sp. Urea-02u-13]